MKRAHVDAMHHFLAVLGFVGLKVQRRRRRRRRRRHHG